MIYKVYIVPYLSFGSKYIFSGKIDIEKPEKHLICLELEKMELGLNFHNQDKNIMMEKKTNGEITLFDVEDDCIICKLIPLSLTGLFIYFTIK